MKAEGNQIKMTYKEAVEICLLGSEQNPFINERPSEFEGDRTRFQAIYYFTKDGLPYTKPIQFSFIDAIRFHKFYKKFKKERQNIYAEIKTKEFLDLYTRKINAVNMIRNGGPIDNGGH